MLNQYSEHRNEDNYIQNLSYRNPHLKNAIEDTSLPSKTQKTTPINKIDYVPPSLAEALGTFDSLPSKRNSLSHIDEYSLSNRHGYSGYESSRPANSLEIDGIANLSSSQTFSYNSSNPVIITDSIYTDKSHSNTNYTDLFFPTDDKHSSKLYGRFLNAISNRISDTPQMIEEDFSKVSKTHTNNSNPQNDTDTMSTSTFCSPKRSVSTFPSNIGGPYGNHFNTTITASNLRREQFSAVLKLLGSCGKIIGFKFGPKYITVTFSTEEEARAALELDETPVCNYIIRVALTSDSYSPLKKPFQNSNFSSTDNPSSPQTTHYNNPMVSTGNQLHNNSDYDFTETSSSASIYLNDTLKFNDHFYNLYEPSEECSHTVNNDFHQPDITHTQKTQMGNDPSSVVPFVKPVGLLIIFINWLLSIT